MRAAADHKAERAADQVADEAAFAAAQPNALPDPSHGTRPHPLPLRFRLLSNLVQAPLFGLVTALFGSLSLLVSFFEADGRIQHRIARLWAAATLFISGSRVTVLGEEKLRDLPIALYAANHVSYMDTPVIFKCLPMQFRILAKHSLWKVPFIGWHLKRSGQIPINAENARASVASLNIGVKALKAGMPLFVFPEGGRSETGELQPFMNGASYIAVRAGVPIVPMALIGTYELLPIHTRQFHPRPLLVVIGEPIFPDGYTTKDLQELTDRLREAIGGLCRQYSGAPPLPGSDGDAMRAIQLDQSPPNRGLPNQGRRFEVPQPESTADRIVAP